MQKDRENDQKFDGTMFMIRGTVGYVGLIALGLLANAFSKELAVQLVMYLLPIMLFILGSASFDVIDGLIEFYKRRKN